MKTRLQQMNTTELEELLMEETKKFTSALHNGTSQGQKDILRKRIEEIQQLLEKKKETLTEILLPERNVEENRIF